jgi:geranylgeranyl reductase family protein
VSVQNNTVKCDVVIVGAGPAACACALTLKDAGLKVAMIDKYSFPRDKVCGDAIPGRAIKTLNSIKPEYAAAFKKFPAKYETKKATLFYQNRTITFNWVLQAYTCTRYEFDNFLFSLVKENTATEIFTNTEADRLSTLNDGISISIKNSNKIFETRLLIGADGAHSVAAKQLTGQALDRKHHVGSVRAYFSGLTNIDNDTIEVYFSKKFLPSYLWVFPLPGNTANVGFGMLSSEISKRKINIKKTIYEFIEQSPVLKQKFQDAKQIGCHVKWQTGCRTSHQML